MSRYWVRFFSPGSDARPVKVPAPCQWWCSGYGENDVAICAVVFSKSAEPWKALEEFWPGLVPSFCQPVTDDWTPGDRFPHKPSSENSYIERVLE